MNDNVIKKFSELSELAEKVTFVSKELFLEISKNGCEDNGDFKRLMEIRNYITGMAVDCKLFHDQVELMFLNK